MVYGTELRGSIAKTTTYRVRHGNGYFGSVKGKKYQDIMDYFVTGDPKTVPQQAWRGIFADAVAAAKVLSEEQKEPYREQAKRKGGQSWISVFVREYLDEHA